MKSKIKSVKLWDEAGDEGGFVKVMDRKESDANYTMPADLFKEKKFCPICKRKTEFQVIPMWGNTKSQFLCLNCNIIITKIQENCPMCEGISPHYHYSTNAFSKHRRFCPKSRVDRSVKLQNGVKCCCGLQLKK